MFTSNIRTMYTFLVLITAGLILYSHTKDLPSYIPRCYRDDPKMWECLINATVTLRPYIGKGIPEISIPPIEPFVLPSFEVMQGTSALNYKAVLLNITIRGMQDYVFRNLSFDRDQLKFYGNVNFAKLHVESNYTITSHIPICNNLIIGEGVFTANISNIEGELFQSSKLTKRDGENYLYPVKTIAAISVDNATAQFNGLFNHNEELAQVTNAVLNANVQEIIHEVKPVIEKVISSIAEDITIKIVSEIPYDKLFPLSKN